MRERIPVSPPRARVPRVVAVSEVTAWQHARRPALVVALVLCGFLLVPFVLLAAHGLPGHATAMSAGAQQGEHDSGGAAIGSEQHHEQHHDAPICDEGPDNSTFATCRPLSGHGADMAFLLLAVAVATAIVAPFGVRPQLRTLLRYWRAKPDWRAAGTSLLSMTCVFRI